MKLIAIIIALIYTLFPADALPDMIPVLGWLDDAALWVLLFWYFFLRLRQEEDPFSGDAGKRREDEGFRQESRSDDRRQASREKTARDSKRDPYQVLGIERGASPEAIKKAYREQAGKYHPDKFAHLGEDFQETAEKRFKEIHEAYRTLMPKN
jgi:DnaJ like chaperone protein